MIRKSLAVVFLATLASPLVAGDNWTVDKNHSSARFEVRHFVTKVGGRFTDVGGSIVTDPAKPESSSVEFVLKTASINTDNENRDKHLRSPDFFDVEKFPELTFKSTKIVPKGNNHFDVTGDLTIHGVTKQVTLPVGYLGSVADKAGFETTVTLNRKDYGIVWNKTLDGGGLMLADEVSVTVNIEANRKKPEGAPAAK